MYDNCMMIDKSDLLKFSSNNPNYEFENFQKMKLQSRKSRRNSGRKSLSKRFNYDPENSKSCSPVVENTETSPRNPLILSQSNCQIQCEIISFTKHDSVKSKYLKLLKENEKLKEKIDMLQKENMLLKKFQEEHDHFYYEQTPEVYHPTSQTEESFENTMRYSIPTTILKKTPLQSLNKKRIDRNKSITFSKALNKSKKQRKRKDIDDTRTDYSPFEIEKRLNKMDLTENKSSSSGKGFANRRYRMNSTKNRKPELNFIRSNRQSPVAKMSNSKTPTAFNNQKSLYLNRLSPLKNNRLSIHSSKDLSLTHQISFQKPKLSTLITMPRRGKIYRKNADSSSKSGKKTQFKSNISFKTEDFEILEQPNKPELHPFDL